MLDKERQGVEEKLPRSRISGMHLTNRSRPRRHGPKAENFTQSLTLYNELKTKQVKDIFLTMPLDVVADFLTAMEPERASKIIGEFKSPDEQKFITGVLERIRTAGMRSAIGDSAGPATLPALSSQARS